jgi:hypothetical protein
VPKLVRTFKKGDRKLTASVPAPGKERKSDAQGKAARRELPNRHARSPEVGSEAAATQSRTAQMPSSGDARLWLAFLSEVDYVGGEASMSDVRLRLQRYGPKLPDGQSAAESLGAQGSWGNCISFVRIHLIRRGYLFGLSRGVVQLTEPGKRWLDANWRGPDGTYRNVTKPPVLDRDARPGRATRNATLTQSSRQEGRSADEARLVRGRIKKALMGKSRRGRDAVDQYLLGVMALELALPADAATLLGAALEMGLDEQFLAKAVRLREMCLEQAGR